MPAPERRTRWDVTAAAVLAVAVLAVWTALWWTSDARRTIAQSTAPGPAPGDTTSHVPVALTEEWRASSPATPVPLVQASTVVTGAAGMVAGRDLRSGAIRWSYRRDRSLCTVAAAFHQVVAVYQGGETCSEVTALDWAQGRRGAQRTGPVQTPTRLVAAGDQVAASGAHYLEVWRSDLVRTLSYGRVPTPAQPATQPRPDCLHGSMALGDGTLGDGTLGDGKLAVVEQCPGERVRLTVQRSDPKDPEQPEVIFSTLLPGKQARVVAVSGERVAVALPDPARLVVLDEQGTEVAEHPLAVPDADLRGNPPGGVVEVTKTMTGVYWFTGSATVALDTGDLRPRWTRLGSLGTGSEVAEALLLPVPGALAVLDTTTGQQVGALPMDRGGYLGPVGTASSSGVVLEQRGDTLVALGEPLVSSTR
ncbi:MAG: Rv3212 family protein [Pseudonocardiaceae bacterium]